MFNLKFNDYTMNRYGYIGEFHEGLARVKTQDCFWGFINKRGKEVTPCCFINASDFSEGLVAVQNKQGLWGYINKEGKEVIPFKYRCASDFKEGRAAVSLEGDRWFYIDKCDNNICKDDYGITMAYDFSDGFGLVRTKYFKFAYIDHNGNVRKDCIKKATLFSNGFD